MTAAKKPGAIKEDTATIVYTVDGKKMEREKALQHLLHHGRTKEEAQLVLDYLARKAYAASFTS